ncbi:MAG: sulfotransferase [Synechococcales bacterium]|nr:sulfotransferase [Synechococcales bacterium]
MPSSSRASSVESTRFKPIQRPIFLAGAERSGTTMLRLMLDHHPQIAWCNEFEYAVDWMGDDGSYPDLGFYYEQLALNRIFQATNFEIDRSLSYPELVNSFLQQRRDRPGKPLIGATVHRNFHRLPYLWPNARFIHIHRDGRDVARSCVRMGWAGNVWKGADRWIRDERQWARFAPQIPGDRQIEITYQELVADHEATLSRVCDFIGVAYSPHMLDYVHSTDYDLPNPHLIQQWRDTLGDREIQLLEGRIGPMLVERGYELSGLPPLACPPPLRLWLTIQSWWAHVSVRIERYGLPLFLSEYVTRRLNLKPWQRQIRQRLNAIDKTYLKKSWSD